MVTKSSGTLTPYYYHYDEKGSITKLTDKSGKTVQDYAYDAFGNLNTEDDALYNPIRYTGQYTDSETGLIYLRNRYYDPTIGRFTQEDPIKDGLNWYVYCANDPVNCVDPWGLDPDYMVMVKYSVEKIGGKVVGFNSSRQIAFISYNGNECGFQIDRVVEIADDNGDLVSRAISNVDSLYEFMSSMGFRGAPEELLNNPYDEFNSMNEAAYAWALRYNKQSMTCINNEDGIGYEMGSYIYLNRDRGTYFFGYPASDYEKNGMTFGSMSKAVAMIHSHDTDDIGYKDEWFSSEDIMNFRGIHRYISTPSGRLIYSWPSANSNNNWYDRIGTVIVGSGTGIYSGGWIDG